MKNFFWILYGSFKSRMQLLLVLNVYKHKRMQSLNHWLTVLCIWKPVLLQFICMHVCPNLYSNQFMHKAKWMFVPDVIRFPSGVLWCWPPDIPITVAHVKTKHVHKLRFDVFSITRHNNAHILKLFIILFQRQENYHPFMHAHQAQPKSCWF